MADVRRKRQSLLCWPAKRGFNGNSCRMEQHGRPCIFTKARNALGYPYAANPETNMMTVEHDPDIRIFTGVTLSTPASWAIR
jgi:hypothetical protein